MPETNFSQDPSLHVGDTTHEDDLHEVMPRAIALFEMSDEEFEKTAPDFVVDRMHELSGGVSTELITNQIKGTEDFIVPERPMEISSVMTRPFLMDDPELYIKSLHWTRIRFKELQASKPDFNEEKLYMNAAIQGTIAGQAYYFGSYAGDMHSLIRATADNPDDENWSPYVSISDIKAAAVCQQRAAAVHNTMHILGIDTRYETGYLGEVTDGEVDKLEHHAYVILKYDGKRILLDPTHPILDRNKDGEVTRLSAMVTKIPEGADELDVQLPEIVTDQGGLRQKRIAHTLRYIL